MSRRYSVNGAALNTQSSTIPIGNLIGAATIRPRIYDVLLGGEGTPADNSSKIQFQRETTVGTWAGAGGAAITPQAIDPADPASLATANQGVCSAGPTLTAAAFLLTMTKNMRGMARWVCDEDRGLVIPATANNGIAMVPTVIGGVAYTEDFTLLFAE